MKNLFPLGLLVLLLIAAQISSAQTIDSVIAKYEDARGGKDKLLSIKTIYMEGIRDMMGTDHVVKVTKEQGRLSRVDFEMGDLNGFTVITPDAAWYYIPFRAPSPFPLPADATAALQSDLDIAGPLVDYAAKGNKAELLGKEIAVGDTCYKIKLTTVNGTAITYWINIHSNLLVQSSQTSGNKFGPNGSTKGNDAPIITQYANYSVDDDNDGILFPHTITIITTGSENGKGGTTSFDKILVNFPMDTTLYSHDIPVPKKKAH
jgi:hypothetical protein